MEKNLDVTKPRYSGQILPVLWPILISKSHCSALPELTIAYHHGVRDIRIWLRGYVGEFLS